MRHLTVLVLLGTVACASVAPSPQAQPIDGGLALLTFDSAWSRIANTHYDTAFGGVDWRGVRTQLRPRAAAARTTPELRAVIGEMLGRLGQSHYGLIPAEVLDAVGGSAEGSEGIEADVGAEVRIIGDEVLIWRLTPEGAAARSGIAPGWTVTHIDSRATASRLRAVGRVPEAQRRNARTSLLYQLNNELAGATGSTVALRLRDERGREFQHTLAR
jgi:C-terminal processing protease CtpA/Prc